MLTDEKLVKDGGELSSVYVQFYAVIGLYGGRYIQDSSLG
jgi:hypothetical protein